MTPQEHYEQAENIIAHVKRRVLDFEDSIVPDKVARGISVSLQLAQTHATLATVPIARSEDGHVGVGYTGLDMSEGGTR